MNAARLAICVHLGCRSQHSRPDICLRLGVGHRMGERPIFLGRLRSCFSTSYFCPNVLFFSDLQIGRRPILNRTFENTATPYLSRAQVKKYNMSSVAD